MASQVFEVPNVGIAERPILKQRQDTDLNRFSIQSDRQRYALKQSVYNVIQAILNKRRPEGLLFHNSSIRCSLTTVIQ